MKFTKLAAVAVAMTVFAGTAQAQVNCTKASGGILAADNCKVQDNVSVSVPWVAVLTLTGGSTSLTSPVIADFGNSNGVTDNDKLSINVKANAVYSITSTAPTSFTYTGSNNGTKLTTDLSLRVGVDGSSSTASNVAVDNQLVANAATATASRVYNIGYNTKYNWASDKPGSYALLITYTLTAP